MCEKVAVYKIVLCVTDHDDLGADAIRRELECGDLFASVEGIAKRTVDWTDDHPLNFGNTASEAFEALFEDHPGAE